MSIHDPLPPSPPPGGRSASGWGPREREGAIGRCLKKAIRVPLGREECLRLYSFLHCPSDLTPQQAYPHSSFPRLPLRFLGGGSLPRRPTTTSAQEQGGLLVEQERPTAVCLERLRQRRLRRCMAHLRRISDLHVLVPAVVCLSLSSPILAGSMTKSPINTLTISMGQSEATTCWGDLMGGRIMPLPACPLSERLQSLVQRTLVEDRIIMTLINQCLVFAL